MNSMHEKQSMILDFLLGKPEGVTLAELVIHLEISKTAVKEHILKLEGMNFVVFQDIRMGVGRPKRFYKLSKTGQEVFPRQYAWLSNQLLEYLTTIMGHDKTEKVMKDLARKVARDLEVEININGTNKIKNLANAMNRLGYKVIVKQSDLRKDAVIEASNCVYHSVAIEHPELCQFDTQLIKSTIGKEVVLESCIAKGGKICRFCIKK